MYDWRQQNNNLVELEGSLFPAEAEVGDSANADQQIMFTHFTVLRVPKPIIYEKVLDHSWVPLNGLVLYYCETLLVFRLGKCKVCGTKGAVTWGCSHSRLGYIW